MTAGKDAEVKQPKKTTRMRVLVTGGAGFIGSHIVDALIEEGHHVCVIDNLSTGFQQNLNPGAIFYNIDLQEPELGPILEREKPDVVIHEAAQTVVTRSVRDPGYDARINILGSLNLIDACMKAGTSRIVYASSCAVYGAPDYLPIDEYHSLNCMSPYGVSKHTVEDYLKVYHAMSGLQYCALRYANVFGPRQNPESEAGVVAIFTNQMLSGRQPVIFGDGNKTRSYVYVGDIVRANLFALYSKYCGIMNIGTERETTDTEIFERLAHLCNYKGLPEYQKLRSGEITRMCLDSTRAEKEIAWRPVTSLNDGLSATVDYYRKVWSPSFTNSPLLNIQLT